MLDIDVRLCYNIIIKGRGGKPMNRKKKSGGKTTASELIILATAILELVKVLIEIIKTFIE